MNCFPEKCDLLIHDCTLLNREFETEEHKSVAIRDGLIQEVGESALMEAQYAPAEKISGAGKLLMPGFVDGHTHVCQQMLRGRSGGTEPMTWSGVLASPVLPTPAASTWIRPRRRLWNPACGRRSAAPPWTSAKPWGAG